MKTIRSTIARRCSVRRRLRAGSAHVALGLAAGCRHHSGITLPPHTRSTTPIRFSSSTPATPGTIASTITITGLQPGENVLAIDLRPATGQLYALGSTSRLYVVDVVTGVGTAVGTGTFAHGARRGQLRVRLQPDRRSHPRRQRLGAEPAPQPRHRRRRGGRHESSRRRRRRGVGLHQQLRGRDDHDALRHRLGDRSARHPGRRQRHARAQRRRITQSARSASTPRRAVGFDITANDGVAYASLTVAGVSGLYTINLATGAATARRHDRPGAAVRGLAVLSRAITLYGVTTTNQLIRFHSAHARHDHRARPRRSPACRSARSVRRHRLPAGDRPALRASAAPAVSIA